MKKVAQPKEHFWDVFDHSIETVAVVDFLLRRGTWEYANEEVLAVVPWSPMLAQHFDLEVSHGSTRRLLLKLAALLHDIAKPQAKTIEASGRMRFLGHAKEGASMAANILERLRFSAKEIKLVEIMVRHHLRPMQMSHDELPTRRAIYRYFRDTGDAGIDILFLSLADHLATRGPHLELAEWREHAQVVEYILTQRFEQESLVVPPKLVNGHDLITIFGMSPGPKIGEVLEAVREAQAAGEIATREEALSYIDHLIASSPSKR
jgi:poly(A) polymerase